jgi:hypothetical protein
MSKKINAVFQVTPSCLHTALSLLSDKGQDGMIKEGFDVWHFLEKNPADRASWLNVGTKEFSSTLQIMPAGLDDFVIYQYTL